MLHSFYDCNLRAYLMHVDFEPDADTAKELYEQLMQILMYIMHICIAILTSIGNKTIHAIGVQ